MKMYLLKLRGLGRILIYKSLGRSIFLFIAYISVVSSISERFEHFTPLNV